MVISEKNIIEGTRVVHAIGTIKAASAWHASGRHPLSTDWRERMLRELIARAEDVDADAIISVDFAIDGLPRHDETGVALERICATGVAVRLTNTVSIGA